MPTNTLTVGGTDGPASSRSGLRSEARGSVNPGGSGGNANNGGSGMGQSASVPEHDRPSKIDLMDRGESIDLDAAISPLQKQATQT